MGGEDERRAMVTTAIYRENEWAKKERDPLLVRHGLERGQLGRASLLRF